MPQQFSDTRFMSAQEKAQVLRAWARFLKNGFKIEHFTKALYHHLTQHCSFIAHMDRGVFHETYFQDPAATLQLLGQFDRTQGCRSVEYGDTGWLRNPDYADINEAMVEAAAGLLAGLRRGLSAQELERAKAEYAAAGARVQALESLAPAALTEKGS